MGYTMEIYVDGACRRNGSHDAIAAAAAVRKERDGSYRHYSRPLTSNSQAITSQQAELAAVIVGLEVALERYRELNSSPRLDVTIHSDSQYAVNCIKRWVFKWMKNGWLTQEGYEVANRNLIEKAFDLQSQLLELGDVEFVWIRRHQNKEADKHCKVALDSIEHGSYDSDDDF